MNVEVCDFRCSDGYGDLGYIEKPVQLGEILVSPVCAKYTLDDVEQSMVFWLVMFRPRRSFDFAGHISDIISQQVIILCTVAVRYFVLITLRSLGILWVHCVLWVFCADNTALYYKTQEKENSNGKRKGFVNKDTEKMIEVIRNLLLYQYKMSPNVAHFLRNEGAVHIDPFDRMMQIAAPDSIDAACNIYEAFRSMLSLLPEGESCPRVWMFQIALGTSVALCINPDVIYTLLLEGESCPRVWMFQIALGTSVALCINPDVQLRV
jgi:hypothetical protein